jgi:hypothetical protein
MTKPRTVLLWGGNDLLTRAVEMFLRAEQMATWQVIRVPADKSISAVVEQAKRTRPDLVILYQPQPTNGADPLMKLIEDQPELRVIADQPELRVITVSLENNVMQLYTKHSITVHHVSDLLSVIEDRYFSENPAQKEVKTNQNDNPSPEPAIIADTD